MITDKQRDQWRLEFEAKLASNKAEIAKLMEEELLDNDGYPTDAALRIIEIWHWDDIKGWFKFIENIWHLRSWGWSEGVFTEDTGFDTADKERYEYHISTAGWSGNESIIHAMQENHMMWGITWVQSRRGGHYIFEGKEIS